MVDFDRSRDDIIRFNKINRRFKLINKKLLRLLIWFVISSWWFNVKKWRLINKNNEIWGVFVIRKRNGRKRNKKNSKRKRWFMEYKSWLIL